MEYKNFAYSRIAVAPSPITTGTVIEILSGDGILYPPPPFNATIWKTGEMPLFTNSEIVTVINVVGDVFTIVRQQEGTNVRNILVGDRISAAITAYTARTFRFLNPTTVTSDYTIVEDDDLIVCDTTNNITITLIESTGLGRVLNIKNINTGIITLVGNGIATIDGEVSQTILQYDNIQLSDYKVGIWLII